MSKMGSGRVYAREEQMFLLQTVCGTENENGLQRDEDDERNWSGLFG